MDFNPFHYHIPNWAQIATEVVTAASIAHNILPPYSWDPEFVREGLADFPEAQKWFRAVFCSRWYKLLVYIAGYIALNARSTFWAKWISTKQQVKDAKANARADVISEMGAGNH